MLLLVDEINWPEGEDAPPADAQELITLLLRQNPLERLGTGKEFLVILDKLQKSKNCF